MSEILENLKNTIMYQIHNATYNPDAEAYAAEKKATAADVSGSDISGADISGADISGADISGAKQDVSGADISGAMCFGTPIQLGPTNFFKKEPFEDFLKDMYKSLSDYKNLKNLIFKTLNEAKAATQKRTDVTGILQITEGGQDRTDRFYLYNKDPTLTDKIDPASTTSLQLASQKPILIPVMSCDAMAEAEERATFSTKRLFNRAFGVLEKVLRIFFWIALAVFGSSLATNLNVYRDWPYRLLYAIYGAVFFFVVIPYVLLWRWAYQKKRPRFYALIPIIGSPIENHFLAVLLSWFTFKTDDEAAMLDTCRI